MGHNYCYSITLLAYEKSLVIMRPALPICCIDSVALCPSWCPYVRLSRF